MKKKKNTIARVVAIVALLSIVLGIIGTGILVLFGGNYSNHSQTEYSEEQIQELLESFSGSTDIRNIEQTLSGATQ